MPPPQGQGSSWRIGPNLSTRGAAAHSERNGVSIDADSIPFDARKPLPYAAKDNAGHWTNEIAPAGFTPVIRICHSGDPDLYCQLLALSPRSKQKKKISKPNLAVAVDVRTEALGIARSPDGEEHEEVSEVHDAVFV